MNKKNKVEIAGHWLMGPHATRSGKLADVRAGLVYGALSDGAPAFGSPHDFQAESGESGERLLDLLLPRPLASELYVGAIRESLAAVRSVAMRGRQATQAWEHPFRYVVDDGEGDAAVVQMVQNGAIGAISSHDPTRDFRLDIAVVPADQRESLALLLELPLLNSGGVRVTAVFWTEDSMLCSAEPWYMTHRFGAEVLRRELLGEDTWQTEAAEHHDIDLATVAVIAKISRRAIPMQKVALSNEELSLLVPPGAQHREEGVTQLFEGGVFTSTSMFGHAY